jgi:ribulose kinase
MTDVDVDIEVLRTEIGALRTNISEVGAKMDMLLAMQVQLVGLQKDIEHTRASVDRAFDGLRATKELAKATDIKLSKAVSAGRGAAFVGAILFAFAQWYVLQQLQVIKGTSEAVIAVDRRLHYIEAKIWPDVAGGRP